MIKVSTDGRSVAGAVVNAATALHYGSVELGTVLTMMAATAATCPPYGSTGWLSILHIEPQIVVLETTAYHSLGIRLLPGRIAESYRCYRYVFEAVDDSNDIALLVINAGIYATANPRMCGPALRQTLHGSK